MRKQLNEETAKENSKATEAEELKIEVERLKAVNMEYYAQAATFQQQYDREKSLKEQLDMRKENMANMLGDTPQMTGKLRSPFDRKANEEKRRTNCATGLAISILISNPSKPRKRSKKN